MIFRVGDVIKWVRETGCHLERVLWADPCQDFLVVIAFDDWLIQQPNAEASANVPKLPKIPFQRTKAEIETALEMCDCLIVQGDPWSSGICPKTARELEERDTFWNGLKPILEDGFSHLYSETRGPLVSKVMETTGWGKNKIYTGLWRIWVSNGNINALTPAYRRRGGCGQAKYLCKHKTAKYVTTFRDRVYMAKVMKNHYFKDKENNLDDTYTFLLNNYYSAGGVRVEKYPEKECFFYHAKQIIAKYPKKRIIRAVGFKAYRKDYHPITSSIRDLAAAPGDRIETDSTPLDVYCVSELNRSLIVGRVTLIISADVFLGAPVGLNPTLEAPSYIETAMCIAHSTRNKDQYFAEIGIKARPGAWPFEGVGKLYVFDGGEADSTQTETVSKALNAPVEIIAGFRPDWKPMVEMLIGLINRHCRKLEGRVQKRNRGDRDPKLKACLTLKEVERVCALAVILLWKRLRQQRCLDRQMMEANLLPTPLKLWEFGLKYRGCPKRANPENIKLVLLPRAQAKVTPRGIKFGDLYYECDRAKKEDWFVSARLREWEVTISYHTHYVDQIYFIHEGAITTAETCVLTPGSETFAGASWADVREYWRDYRAQANSYLELEHRKDKMDFQLEMKAIEKPAKKATREAIDAAGISDHARKKGVKANRKDEKKRLRVEAADSAFPPVEPSTSPNTPLHVPPMEPYIAPVDNAEYLEELLKQHGQ